MTAASEETAPLRVLVTGAGGQLGHDVVRAATRAAHDVVGVARSELDVVDETAVRELVERFAPHAVIHCAAWTAVDDAESEREAAFAVNEAGSRNVARACRDAGAHLVAVSTDYVFAGTDPAGYAELDEVDPINVYGASKLAGERAIVELLPSATIARTAWLFGADGANFVRTIARLAAERDHLEVVTDQVGSPTWTGHLAAALVTCAERRIAGVLHLAGSPPATWFEVAQEVVRVVGADCEVRPTTSDRFPRPAPRPACSILRVTRPDTPPVGDWRDGVRSVLETHPVHA